MGWHIIETLVPTDEPTVVWADSDRRDWGSVARFQRLDGVDVLSIVTTVWATPVRSFEERELGEPIYDQVVRGTKRPRRVVAHHVVGPEDQPYGVQLWIGDPDEPLEPRPRTAGMLWDLANGAVHNTKDTFSLRANDLTNYGRIRDVDQFFNRVFRFDGVAEVVELCNNPESGARLHSSVTLLHDDLHLVNLQIVAKPFNGLVRGIGHDITQWDPPLVDPSTAMRVAGATPADHICALIAFSRDDRNAPSIAYWVTDPPSWMNYWTPTGPTFRGKGGLIHPEDRSVLQAAREEVDRQSSDSQTPLETSCVVQLKAADGAWVKTTVALSQYPTNSQTRMLYVARILVNPDSSSAAVQPTGSASAK